MSAASELPLEFRWGSESPNYRQVVVSVLVEEVRLAVGVEDVRSSQTPADGTAVIALAQMESALPVATANSCRAALVALGDKELDQTHSRRALLIVPEHNSEPVRA